MTRVAGGVIADSCRQSYNRPVGELRAADGRIVLLDILRGVCFAVMTVDHSPGDPLTRFSNANYGIAGFFTAALGFVFISGLVAGIIYEKHRLRYGSSSTTGRIFRRLRGLYLTQVLLCMVLLAAVTLHVHGVDQWRLDLFSTAPWKGLLFSTTLLYEPGYLGILPMYCLFLACTPFLLSQFEKGRARLALSTSFALWIIAGLALHPPRNPHGVDFGAFNPLSYQVLFIVGLAFGAGQLSVGHLSPRQQRFVVASSVLLTVMFFALRQDYAVRGPLSASLDRLTHLFSSVELGPLRLLNFAAFAVVLYWLSTSVEWSAIRTVWVRWLAFVGRHSLPVFAWSILVTYAAVAVLPSDPGLAAAAVSAVLVTASLTIPAQLRAMFVRRRVAGPSATQSGRDQEVGDAVARARAAPEAPVEEAPVELLREAGALRR